jgi:TonB-linked SusC/RagA family outer membrane protein
MKMKLALLCAMLAMTFFSTHVIAQALQVTGRVTNKTTGQSLSGASVMVKGTTTGTTTDANGNFSISVPNSNSVLVVGFAGMDNMEVAVTRSGSITVEMNERPTSLNEVVVIGYGQTKKSLVTGAISSVKSEQLETVSSTRIDQALQGRVAGVQVSPTSGQPGAGLNIRIRGTGSNRNSSPLFIVDGVRTGGIEYIDPSEVASIEILKDAASAAIYGAEGANGVVIISTKTGRRNSAEIAYSGQYGVQSVKKDFIKMMNAQQYQQYLQEAGVSGRPTPADVAGLQGTNWLNEVLGTAPQMHHSLTFSGGSDRSTYLLSGTYFSQEGVVGGEKSKFDRYTVRFNGDNKVKSWWNIGNRLSYSHHVRRAISDNNEFGSILGSALVMDPTTPVTYSNGAAYPAHVQAAMAGTTPDGTPISKLLRYDPNGNLYGISNYLRGEYGNPLARIELARGSNVQDKIVGNVFSELDLLKGLKFTTRFGVDLAFQTGHGWTPTFWYSSESLNTIANGYDYSNKWFTWMLENFATYNRKFGNHNFTLLAGTSQQKTHETHMGGSYSGLFKEEDRFSYADFVPDNVDRIGSIELDRTLASFYGRLSYDFKNKYLFNATLRRDGSSLFAPGYQWGTFPSVSAGWVISNEDFYSGLSNTVNYAKLRGSWGQNGSLSSVGLGEWRNSISVTGPYYNGVGVNLQGAAPNSLANPELTWETSEQLNFGLDLGLLSNKLNVTVDYFKKTTKDLLTGGNAPMFVGNNIRTVNAGNVENKGWEFEIGYRNRPSRAGAFSYEFNANLTSIKNNVTYLDPNSPLLPGTGVGTGWTATAMQQGFPIWYFQGYKTAGIFQNTAEVSSYLAKTGITGYNPKPGEPIVVDVNGDKQITPGGDWTMIGSPHPDLTYGFRVNLAYKGFDFLAFVQGQSGNEMIMAFNRTDRSTANKPLFFYTNRWTGEGSTNTWFAANASNPYVYNSDLMVFDGSFTRIRQLQLGYTLGAQTASRLRIKNARVYVSLDDFFTFTKYPGVDPEGGSNGGNSIGLDRGGYPIPRKALVGLTFNF